MGERGVPDGFREHVEWASGRDTQAPERSEEEVASRIKSALRTHGAGGALLEASRVADETAGPGYSCGAPAWCGLDLGHDGKHAFADELPGPAPEGGGLPEDVREAVRRHVFETVPGIYGGQEWKIVDATIAATLAAAGSGGGLDREAARRIREQLKNGPGCSFLRGCVCDFRLQERTHQEWLDHYDDAFAAALAPLLTGGGAP